MSDIFISYAREDKSRVEPLAQALAAHGWSVWWDPHIPLGKYFDDVIEQALKEAKCIIVVWSKNSVSSRWVRTEANEGVDRGILVPVLIEQETTIPLAFRQIQSAHLVEWDGSLTHVEFEKLIRDISALLGPPSASPTTTNISTVDTKSSPTPPEESKPKNVSIRLRQMFFESWRKILVASVAVILLGALAVWAIKSNRNAGDVANTNQTNQSNANTTEDGDTSPTESETDTTAKVEEPPAKTPGFTNRQLYLDAAPEGIDARYAWTLPGGTGKDVHIVFVGGATTFAHELIALYRFSSRRLPRKTTHTKDWLTIGFTSTHSGSTGIERITGA